MELNSQAPPTNGWGPLTIGRELISQNRMGGANLQAQPTTLGWDSRVDTIWVELTSQAPPTIKIQDSRCCCVVKEGLLAPASWFRVGAEGLFTSKGLDFGGPPVGLPKGLMEEEPNVALGCGCWGVGFVRASRLTSWASSPKKSSSTLLGYGGQSTKV